MSYLRPALALIALAATACGGTAATNEGAAPAATQAAVTTTVPATGGGPTTGAAATGPSIVPDVSVVDVSSGGSVALRGAVATDRPTLIWMWAPH